MAGKGSGQGCRREQALQQHACGIEFILEVGSMGDVSSGTETEVSGQEEEEGLESLAVGLHQLN